MKKKLLKLNFIFLLGILMFTNNSFSQIAPDNLNGEDLKEWLRTNYYDGKHNGLGYSTARVYMYNYIDNHNNTITG